ncbi:MAG: hypothetical protein IH792_05800 [Thaumarchaeota archaeon]|nr:hypothetical protein [Nitrososphaerota archaeon]
MKRGKILTVTLSLVMLLSVTSYSVSAEEDPVNVSEWEEYDKDKILNDPFAQRLLEYIELSKQRIAELENHQRIQTEHEKFIEQQRQIANAQLQEELDRMNKKYADKTPRAAFAKFVSQYPEEYHDYYWSLFNYMYSKVEIAREHRDQILANGGSIQQALQAFNEDASITRAERIQFSSDMVDKYELYNKVSDINDFNALPDETKAAFVAHMEQKGLGKYALNPMYDKKPSSEMKTIETPMETQVFVIDYDESSASEQISEVSSQENELLEFTSEAATLNDENNFEVEEFTCGEEYQLMQKTGSETQVCVTENSVSKLVERGWGTPIN